MAAASEAALLRRLPNGNTRRRLLQPPVVRGDPKVSGSFRARREIDREIRLVW
jgi:hypothetical protein